MGRKVISVLILLCALWTTNARTADYTDRNPDCFRVIGGFHIPDDASLVSTATPEGRLIVFDDAWETIQERLHRPAFPGCDWQAKPNGFRAPAGKAANTQE